MNRGMRSCFPGDFTHRKSAGCHLTHGLQRVSDENTVTDICEMKNHYADEWEQKNTKRPQEIHDSDGQTNLFVPDTDDFLRCRNSRTAAHTVTNTDQKREFFVEME